MSDSRKKPLALARKAVCCIASAALAATMIVLPAQPVRQAHAAASSWSQNIPDGSAVSGGTQIAIPRTATVTPGANTEKKSNSDGDVLLVAGQENVAKTATGSATVKVASAAKIGGRAVDLTIKITASLGAYCGAADQPKNQTGKTCFARINKWNTLVLGCTESKSGGYQLTSKKSIKVATAVTWAGTDAVVSLPFMMKFSDLDQVQKVDGKEYCREGVSLDSGFNTSSGIWSNWSRNKLEKSSSGWSFYPSSDLDTDTGGDDFDIAGFFAQTVNGSFTTTFTDGLCETQYQLFSPYANQAAPAKSVDSSKWYQAGDEVVWTVTQKEPKFYDNTLITYSSWKIEDELPAEVEYVSATATWSGTALEGAVSYDEGSRKVTATIPSSYLSDKSKYTGGNVVLKITTKALEPEGTKAAASNKTTSTIDGQTYTSGTVTVNILGHRDVTVEKSWDDDGDRDGLQSDSVDVTLKGSDGSSRESTLSADNEWSHKFTGLPCYTTSGSEITYMAEEDVPSGYTCEAEKSSDGSVITLTNTHQVYTLDIPVETVWDDDGDRDGLRTTTATYTLTDDKGNEYDLETNEDGEWNSDFEVPQYRNHGTEISYELFADGIDGYQIEIEGDQASGFTVTNVHTPAKRDIAVEKSWDDDGDRDGLRPVSVSVSLSGTDGTAKELTIDDSTSWTGSFEGLYVYYDHGKKIEYALSEPTLPDGYSCKVEKGEDGDSYTLINKHEISRIDIPVNATFADDGDRDGVRPDTVTATLTGSDGSSTKIDMSKDGWENTLKDLPKFYDHGTEITYTLTEDAPDGYSVEVSGDQKSGFACANVHVPETLSIPVTKSWDDDGDRDGLRPDSVTVSLTGSDGTSATIELTSQAQWKGSFEGLHVYHDHGTKVEYTLSEPTVADGYESAVSGDQASGFTVTNTHEIAVMAVPVKKVWAGEGEDKEWSEGDASYTKTYPERPDSVTVELTGTDGWSDTAIISSSGGWASSFAEVPVYTDHGKTATYELSEKHVKGYKAKVEGTVKDGFTVTNTAQPTIVGMADATPEDADDGDADGDGEGKGSSLDKTGTELLAAAVVALLAAAAVFAALGARSRRRAEDAAAAETAQAAEDAAGDGSEQ